MEARMHWDNIKCWQKETINQEPYIQYKISFENKVEIKTFLDKQNQRQSVASETTLQKIQKEIVQAESKWPQMISQISHRENKGNHKVIT